MEPLIGVKEVAQYFKRTEQTVRRWIKQEKLTCYKKFSGQYHFLETTIKGMGRPS